MKKNVASQVIGAQMITASDGSAFTGSVTVSVTGDGGTQATGSVGSGACTHEGNGFHTYAPAQAETNYNHVAFTFTGTGAIPVTIQVYTSFPQTVDNNTLLSAISGRIPAALVSGRMDSSVGAMAANTLTATAIATDAITAAKIAANAIGASELATDAVTEIQSGLATAAELAKVPKSDSTVTWNATALASINAEVDTALADYDAPTNTEMTSAFTEIKGATWATTDTLEAIRDRGDAAWTTADVSALATSSALATVDSNVDAILADTNELQTNQGNWLTATGFATSGALSAIDGKIGTPSVTLADDIAGISAGSGLTAQEVRDAMKLAPTAGAPAAGSVDAHLDTIEADTNELQGNQGNWATATGFATSADLATVDGNIDAVKAKTDQLVFTKTNELDVNVQSINGGEITGDGKTTPFDVA